MIIQVLHLRKIGHGIKYLSMSTRSSGAGVYSCVMFLMSYNQSLCSRATLCAQTFSWILVTGQQCPTLTWAGRRRESSTSTKLLGSSVWRRWQRTCWVMIPQHSTYMSHVSQDKYLHKWLHNTSTSSEVGVWGPCRFSKAILELLGGFCWEFGVNTKY